MSTTTTYSGGTLVPATGTTPLAPTPPTLAPTALPPTSIFSEANLARHVEAVFEDVPAEHHWATVGYAAYENGRWVTKFSLVTRSEDGSWQGALVAQYASGAGGGFGAGAWIKKSW